MFPFTNSREGHLISLSCHSLLFYCCLFQQINAILSQGLLSPGAKKQNTNFYLPRPYLFLCIPNITNHFGQHQADNKIWCLWRENVSCVLYLCFFRDFVKASLLFMGRAEKQKLQQTHPRCVFPCWPFDVGRPAVLNTIKQIRIKGPEYQGLL